MKIYPLCTMTISMKVLSTYVIIVLGFICYSSCEYSSVPYALSSTYLTDLSKREEKVHATVKQYLNSLEERLKLVKAYLTDYDDSHIKVEKNYLDSNPAETLRNIEDSASPVTSFKMISRFVTDLRAIVRIRDDAETTFVNQMIEIEGLHNWPTENDEHDIMDAILRIQFFYKLNLTEFVEGNINGTQTGVKLSSRQCWSISQFAMGLQFYTLALEWLDVTKWKLRQENPQDRWPGLSEEIVIAAERSVRERHDENFDDNSKNGNLFIFTSRIGNRPELPTTMRDHLISNFVGREFCTKNEFSFINFVALCNGYNFQDKEERKKLRCWLERDRHSYFKINPLKMELLNDTPYLVQIHDFVGEHWIQLLKRTAIPTLRRPPPRKDDETTPRTAIYAWLSDDDIKEIDLIDKIEFLTGIKVATQKASDLLQIASYTFGGHVGLHVDSLDKNAHLDPRGDRIFTLLMYLNDAEQGGLTVFQPMGTSVKPLKGSAVLWYNSLKNGQVDRRMVHAACPLLLGQKWIATKWTHLNENMFKWPCSTDPDS